MGAEHRRPIVYSTHYTYYTSYPYQVGAEHRRPAGSARDIAGRPPACRRLREPLGRTLTLTLTPNPNPNPNPHPHPHPHPHQVSYSGCFSKRFREQLLASTYLPYLTGEIPAAKGGVPLSEGADPLNILCTEAERALWSSQNLPADRVSVENGAPPTPLPWLHLLPCSPPLLITYYVLLITYHVLPGAIVCSCARWPLMIDPQLQGVTWIKKREEQNGVKVCYLVITPR